MPQPAVSPAPASERRYSPAVVRFVLRAQRLLRRAGISPLIFALLGNPLYLALRWAVWRRNEILVLGKDRVPALGTGFFCLCNHVSMAEAPTIASLLLPRPQWFPSKAEFYRGWLSGLLWTLVTAGRTFPVRRGERDVEAIGLMEQCLAGGDCVLLFPEGTRSRDLSLQPGKKGVGMVIHNVRPVVVPVYVRGFEKIWPPGRMLPLGTGQRAFVVFGRPLDLSHWWTRPFSPETGQGIADEVMAAIASLKDELDEASKSLPPPAG